MGLAAYGYEWNERTGRAINYASIESIIKKHGINPKWHDQYQTPYFTYTKSGERYEVWYENQNSTAAKMRLVDKYKLRGVAVWRLGYEDPRIWSVL
jgi:spore germination protein